MADVTTVDAIEETTVTITATIIAVNRKLTTAEETAFNLKTSLANSIRPVELPSHHLLRLEFFGLTSFISYECQLLVFPS